MLGNGRGDGHQGKEEPLKPPAGQGLSQLPVGLIGQVNRGRVAEGEVGGLKVEGEFGVVQLVQVGHQHKGGHQVKAADDAVTVNVGNGPRQAGIGAVHAGGEQIAGSAVNERLVDAGVERLAQLLHHVDDHNGRGEEKEGDQAVGKQLAGVDPAAGGHDVVEGVPEAQGGQGQDKHPAQRRREGVDQQLDKVADVVRHPAVDAFGNDGHGQRRPVDRPQNLGQGVLQEVDGFGKVTAGIKHRGPPGRCVGSSGDH